jgi:hypothetical protein
MITPSLGVIPAARVDMGSSEAVSNSHQTLVGFYSTSTNGAFDNDQMCDSLTQTPR